MAKQFKYYNLCVITDKNLIGKRSMTKIIKSTILGGVTTIQYREKSNETGLMIKQAYELHKITLKFKIPLIINDRVDVALAVDAEGVHVGQKDMPASKARKIIGKKKILGVSANTVKEAIQAQKDGADYLGVGPIFPTSTKIDADPAIGIEGLKEIRNAVKIPIIAIGSINRQNAKEVIKFADGIAVISAVLGAKNPLLATRELAFIVNPKNKPK